MVLGALDRIGSGVFEGCGCRPRANDQRRGGSGAATGQRAKYEDQAENRTEAMGADTGLGQRGDPGRKLHVVRISKDVSWHLTGRADVQPSGRTPGFGSTSEPTRAELVRSSPDVALAVRTVA